MAGTKTQGTFMRVSTAVGATKTITAITAANPPVVTSTAHALTAGTIIRITGVVGMTELNGRCFVVRNPLTNSFELGGIDATGYTAYASGGIATPQTMTELGKVTDAEHFDGQAGDIDVTHLRSTAMEKQQGLPDPGGGNFNMICDNTDVGQARMRTLRAQQVAGVFSITATDGTVSAFPAFVKQFSASFAGNNVIRSAAALSYEYEPSWFA